MFERQRYGIFPKPKVLCYYYIKNFLKVSTNEKQPAQANIPEVCNLCHSEMAMPNCRNPLVLYILVEHSLPKSGVSTNENKPKKINLYQIIQEG